MKKSIKINWSGFLEGSMTVTSNTKANKVVKDLTTLQQIAIKTDKTSHPINKTNSFIRRETLKEHQRSIQQKYNLKINVG